MLVNIAFPSKFCTKVRHATTSWPFGSYIYIVQLAIMDISKLRNLTTRTPVNVTTE
jgi:hypothetical protein